MRRPALPPIRAALLLLALAACGPVNPAARPADTADFAPAAEPALQPGDEVEVKFRYTPELDERQVIRPDGRIAMPLIDGVPAAGLSVPQLHDALVRAYARQLAAPELSVLLRSAAAERVFVAGEVNRQGAEALTGPLTVSQAVALAEGLKPTAYRSQVLVIRRGAGRSEVRVVDLGSVLKGETPRQDVSLQPADIVYVPRSPIAEVDQFVDQYIRQALPTQTSFSYVLGPGLHP